MWCLQASCILHNCTILCQGCHTKVPMPIVHVMLSQLHYLPPTHNLALSLLPTRLGRSLGTRLPVQLPVPHVPTLTTTPAYIYCMYRSLCYFSSLPQTTRTGSSPLPFFPKQRPESVLPSYTEDSSLLSSLSISALSEYKGRRKLGELLLPDGVSIVTDGKSRRSLSEKVGLLERGEEGFTLHTTLSPIIPPFSFSLSFSFFLVLPFLPHSLSPSFPLSFFSLSLPPHSIRSQKPWI